MSRNRCCVPGCFDSGHSHTVLHGFPNPDKNPELFRSWVYAVGGDILGLDNQVIYKLRRVCHNHFEEKHCCRFNRISKLAVPTINIPGPLAIPQFSIADRRPLRVTHNILMDTPSSSKDPVIFMSEVVSAVSDFQLSSTKGDSEKENMSPITGPSLDVTMKGNPISNKTIDTEMNTVPIKIQSTLPTTIKTLCKRRKTFMKTTKAEEKLHKKLIELRVKLSKCRNYINKQKLELKLAKKIFSNSEFVNAMDNWTTSAKLLTLLQFREYKKKSKGHRFSTDEKILALTLLKQSPKAYRFIRKIFILPSRQILSNFLNKCALKPGINKPIFAQLETKAKQMKAEHKLCALVFDEMQIKAGISYNERKDTVSGFVTDGQETKKILADHAQVYLIRGLVKNYKQPVAYTFSAGATKGCEIAKQLKEIIVQLQIAGFIVLAIICDQGTNNRQAIKLLVEETRRIYIRQEREIPWDNVININSLEIIPIFDPPHLLKGIRNNLLTKDLKYIINGKAGTAKWRHVEMLHQENPAYKGVCLMPNLTDAHVIPSKIRKMKVKYASQIFSRKISSNMGYLAEKGILPKECQETADFSYSWIHYSTP